MSSQVVDSYDIVIVGAGLAGLSLALSISHLPFNILLIDAKPELCNKPENSLAKSRYSQQMDFQGGAKRNERRSLHIVNEQANELCNKPENSLAKSIDTRAIALAYSSKLIFEQLGIWAELTNKASEIKQVHVSDKGHFGFTRIKAKDYAVPALGYVLPITELVQVLQQKINTLISSNFTFLRPAEVVSYNFVNKTSLLTLKTAHGEKEIEANLILAADGQNSTLAHLLEIPRSEVDYNQFAIVANIGLKNDHHHIAYERFTEWGAIAMLPSQGSQVTSIITINNERAKFWLALSDEAYLQELQQAFGYRLGRFSWLGRRQQYPLKGSLLQENVKNNAIFLGNASHSLHPIAAQGFNLGLRDVAQIAHSLSVPIDFHNIAKDYQQGRYWDHRLQTSFTHSLTQIFGNHRPLVSLFRNISLLMLDQLPPLKKILAKKLMGMDSVTLIKLNKERTLF